MKVNETIANGESFQKEDRNMKNINIAVTLSLISFKSTLARVAES